MPPRRRGLRGKEPEAPAGVEACRPIGVGTVEERLASHTPMCTVPLAARSRDPRLPFREIADETPRHPRFVATRCACACPERRSNPQPEPLPNEVRGLSLDRLSSQWTKLEGVIGRVAGTSDFKNYTVELKASAVVWTEQRLDAYIADPATVVPGTSMSAAGRVESAAERRAIVAHLKRQDRSIDLCL